MSAKLGSPPGPCEIPGCAAIARTRPDFFQKVSAALRSGSGPTPGRQQLAFQRGPSKSREQQPLAVPAPSFSRMCHWPSCWACALDRVNQSWVPLGLVQIPRDALTARTRPGLFPTRCQVLFVGAAVGPELGKAELAWGLFGVKELSRGEGVPSNRTPSDHPEMLRNSSSLGGRRYR